MALVLAGLLVGLGLGELAMRLLHPRTLPSLEALDGADTREVGEFMRWNDASLRAAGCRPTEPAKLHYRQRNATYAPAGKPPSPAALKLWVAGDSLVAGWGVGPNQAWPHVLAQQAANALDERVMLTLAGGGGLGYCEILSDLHVLLDRSRPDVVVVQIFADDLEQRALLALNGGVAARPDAAPGPLAWLARRSWLANRVWFAWVTRLSGAAPLRAADASSQRQFLRALDGIEARLTEAGAKTLFALVPPAGIQRCEGAPAWSDCDWLSQDMSWMATALEASEHRWVDLRSIWETHDPETLRDEEAAWRERGRLPVHPGEGGHAALAEAVLPALLGVVGDR